MLNNLSSGTGAGEHVPSAVFVDLELRLLIVCTRARTCDRILPRAADLRKRGHRGHFARRLNTIGEEIVDLILDRQRKWVNDLTDLQCFLVYNMCGGGTRLWSRVYVSGTVVRRILELIDTRLRGVDSSANYEGRRGAAQHCHARAFLP